MFKATCILGLMVLHAGSLQADEDATQTLWPAPSNTQVRWAL